ncbi:cytochrome d ubiquinol oxidase subunit II [Halomonas sp. McH1-25]|uniref:cytochrome d ubiquinol oxidase subunit II n=1 Tax=unclassified Halomonas TaxID=2609666 RepID=UPI001EF4FF8A|nr:MULTISPECIES: cytochrome d ubiquinol oxidase subunit II [unclassified Halomonas]MCG7598588.1 cytochrome d ubiquinol oxidase subunit II [Halomonas sp. McH1-25]MCP1342284.1 cytochrome d ubiquinol oxidase subunit II [Halomonas sp. FL8]MCP1360619.1 cytochrome d ubiquinol oxidase subunit II [Halomonas sp. BBD45]
MDTYVLSTIWAVIIAFSIIMYVLLDGFVLGMGILFPLAPDEEARDVMMNTGAPIWDGNETWLVLAGTTLLGAFPLVYTIILPALYIGVFLMVAALIFRGVAFELRFKSHRSRKWWNLAFAGGSAVAAFAQGAVVGAYILGFETESRTFAGGPFDWLTPFTIMTGLGMMAGLALLGATWIIMKTEGAVQDWAFRLVPKLLAGVLLVFAIVSLWTPYVDPNVWNRWFSNIQFIWILPAMALLSAALLFWAVKQRRDRLPFLATLSMFIFTYLGLLVSRWPYVVPPNHTLWDAAASPSSQLFLLIGTLFVIPIILGYTAWAYWVFRGKVRPGEGYH